MKLPLLALLLGAACSHGDGRERAVKAGALVLLLSGVALRFGWLGMPPGEKADIAWLHDETLAVQQSRATGKPLLIDFGAEWCAACKELDLHTWTDPVVASEVKAKFVPLKVDATNIDDRMQALLDKYSVQGLPAVLMVACRDPEPKCAVPQDGPGRVTGFLPPPEMLERLRRLE